MTPTRDRLIPREPQLTTEAGQHPARVAHPRDRHSRQSPHLEYPNPIQGQRSHLQLSGGLPLAASSSRSELSATALRGAVWKAQTTRQRQDTRLPALCAVLLLALFGFLKMRFVPFVTVSGGQAGSKMLSSWKGKRKPQERDVARESLHRSAPWVAWHTGPQVSEGWPILAFGLRKTPLAAVRRDPRRRGWDGG